MTFKGSHRGVAGVRPTKIGLVGYFDVMRRLPADPRIRSVAPYGRRLFMQHFRLDDDELDEEFVGWLEEADAVGCGAHPG